MVVGEVHYVRRRADDVDRWVGKRVRERRLTLGLSQQQLAQLLGVTYQQAHKYEKGVNRIAAGQLYMIARTLGVDVSYFFDGLVDGEGLKPPAPQRMLLELARNFQALPSARQQGVLCELARIMVEGERLAA
ncbi:MAG: helix-turn-helix domain-containing protein [Rhodospirillales bacterium]|nr:helix-turn-helix domain-containing protein [Rhodospirillales bacterium]